MVEHLWQSYEHQSRTGTHTFCTHEHVNGRNYHQSGKYGYERIEHLYAVDSLAEVYALLHIRTVCHHDTHGYGERIEQLSHGIEGYHKDAAKRQSVEVWQEIDRRAFNTRTGYAIGVSMAYEERIYAD